MKPSANIGNKTNMKKFYEFKNDGITYYYKHKSLRDQAIASYKKTGFAIVELLMTADIAVNEHNQILKSRYPINDLIQGKQYV